jgi:hypothetical protein
MTMRQGVRVGAAAAAVVAVAMAGACGGGSGHGSSGGAAPLDAGQARSVLPDARSMPGWTFHGETVRGGGATKPEVRKTFCSSMAKACAGLTSAWDETLTGKHHRTTRLGIYAYRGRAAADAGFDAIGWAAHAPQGAGWKKNGIGTVGAERVAWYTNATKGDPGAFASEIRVGTVVLVTMDVAISGRLDPASAKGVALLAARRAQQAQNGEKPSARLG